MHSKKQRWHACLSFIFIRVIMPDKFGTILYFLFFLKSVEILPDRPAHALMRAVCFVDDGSWKTVSLTTTHCSVNSLTKSLHTVATTLYDLVWIHALSHKELVSKVTNLLLEPIPTDLLEIPEVLHSQSFRFCPVKQENVCGRYRDLI